MSEKKNPIRGHHMQQRQNGTSKRWKHNYDPKDMKEPKSFCCVCKGKQKCAVEYKEPRDLKKPENSSRGSLPRWKKIPLDGCLPYPSLSIVLVWCHPCVLRMRQSNLSENSDVSTKISTVATYTGAMFMWSVHKINKSTTQLPMFTFSWKGNSRNLTCYLPMKLQNGCMYLGWTIPLSSH